MLACFEKCPFLGYLLQLCYKSIASIDNRFCTWMTIYMFMGEDELVLDDSLFLGKGSRRICYCHPQDRNKCIKIDVNERQRTTPRELKYYKRYAGKGIRFDLIAPYYGSVTTNKGKGYVFGLVRDYDGQVSKSVGHYLNVCRHEQVLDGLMQGVLELKEFMIVYGIMARTIERQNMLYQRTDFHNGRVVFIDGIGNNQFLPSANYLRFHARRVVRRKWLKFERQLMNWYRDNPLVYSRLKVLNENNL